MYFSLKNLVITSERVCYVTDKCFLVGCVSPWERKMSWCRLLSNPSLFQMIFQILQRLLKVCGKEYIHLDAVFDTQYVCYSLFHFCSWISDWSLLAQIFATLFFFFFFHVLWLALSKCQCLGDLQCFLIFFLLCFLLLLCSPPTMTKKCLTLCSALALSIAKICGFMGTECCFQTIFFVLSMIDFSWVRYLMRTLAGKHLLSSPLCVSLLFSNTEAQPPKLVILDSRNQFWI